MKRRNVYVSAAALAILGVLFYLSKPEELAAVLAAVVFHELGHIIALWLLGLHIKGFRAEARGFCIDYYGYTGAFGHAVAAAAGPVMGFAYAYAASKYGTELNNPTLCLSAGTSLLLSIFNLLPAMPLDGGRIFAQLSIAIFGDRKGEILSSAVSFFTALCMLLFGVWLMLHEQGAALLVASIWLLLYQEDRRGIVKRREIL